MAVLAIQTEPHPFADNIVYANSSIIRKLNLPTNRPFDLSFGNKKVTVYVGPSSSKGNLLRIPNFIAKDLLLPNGVQVQAKYKDNAGLQLGPIIGILVQNILDNQPKTPFGKFTPFATEVIEKARLKGVLTYIFTLNDINQQTDSVLGWTLNNNQWKKGTFPIPNVVYNRISSRNHEKKLIKSITQLQQKYNFTFFNNSFLNKWEVYQMLNSTPIKSVMPETKFYKGSTTIKEMLAKFPVIYLKPTNGSLGRGIIRIERNLSSYKVEYSRAQGLTTLTFQTFTKMYNYLKPRLSSHTYLVQRGINLLAYQNRPIDFRILVQKNSTGKWAVTSMVSRIANDYHIVSNLAQGGIQGNVFETIQLANPELAKKINRSKFKNYALTIAKQLESSTNGHFAEMGIDLALDNSGRIWLLEVNSKPSKTSDPNIANEPRPSVNRLIQYVLYLTGFPVENMLNSKRKGSGGT